MRKHTILTLFTFLLTVITATPATSAYDPCTDLILKYVDPSNSKAALQNCQADQAKVDILHKETINLVIQQKEEGRRVYKSPFRRLFKSIHDLTTLRVINFYTGESFNTELNSQKALNHNTFRTLSQLDDLYRRTAGNDLLTAQLDKIKNHVFPEIGTGGEESLNSGITPTTPPPNVALGPENTALPEGFFNTTVALDWEVNNPTIVIDVDNDGLDEALIVGSSVPDGSDTKLIHAIKHDGSEARGFPILAPSNIGIPAANRADNILVAASRNGFEAYVWNLQGQLQQVIDIFGSMLENPVIAQVVPGGRNELIFLDWFNDSILVTDQQGNIIPGFTGQPVQHTLKGWVAAGDVNNDNRVDFAVNSDDEFTYLFRDNGSVNSNYPVGLGSVSGWISYTLGSPSIADLSSNNNKQVVVGGEQVLAAFNPNGSRRFRNALHTDEEFNTEPVIATFPGAPQFISTSTDNGQALWNTLTAYEEYLNKLYFNDGSLHAEGKLWNDDDFADGATQLMADVNCDNAADSIVTMRQFSRSRTRLPVLYAFDASGTPIDEEFPAPTVTPVNLPRVIETPHNYPALYTQTDIIRVPGFSNISIELKADANYFWDHIEVFNPTTGEVVLRLEGNRFLARPRYTPSVPGDSIGIRLISPPCVAWLCGGGSYGYRVTKAVNQELKRQTDKWPIYLNEDLTTQPAVGKFFPNGRMGVVIPLKQQVKFIPLNCNSTPATINSWPQFRGNPEHNGIR